jgi:hypothetical protein
MYSKHRGTYLCINVNISIPSPLPSPLILKAEIEIHVPLSRWEPCLRRMRILSYYNVSQWEMLVPYLPPASRSDVPIDHFGHLSFNGGAYEQPENHQQKEGHD